MLNFHVSLYQAKKWEKQPWKRVNCFQIKIKYCIEPSFASMMGNLGNWIENLRSYYSGKSKMEFARVSHVVRLGWGIRGSTDTKRHDRRDVSGLTMVFLFASHLDTLTLARAVAWSTVAIGFGGLINRGLICQLGIFHCRTVAQG